MKFGHVGLNPGLRKSLPTLDFAGFSPPCHVGAQTKTLEGDHRNRRSKKWVNQGYFVRKNQRPSLAMALPAGFEPATHGVEICCSMLPFCYPTGRHDLIPVVAEAYSG